MDSPKIFLTGPPGCGKTTLIERTLASLGKPASGFHTREIREKGRRVGFLIAALNGHKALLAHRDMKSSYRVGAYGVHIENLERVALASLAGRPPEDVLVIDEVGKMECLSPAFCEAVRAALSGPNPVLGTVGMSGGGFIKEVRERPGIRLIHVTPANRDQLPELLRRELQR